MSDPYMPMLVVCILSLFAAAVAIGLHWAYVVTMSLGELRRDVLRIDQDVRYMRRHNVLDDEDDEWDELDDPETEGDDE